MKPVLILKVGSTVSRLIARRGDFDDWIRSGMSRTEEDAIVFDPRDGGSFPSIDSTSGIIVTGSSAMITDDEPWSVATEAWLEDTLVAGVPILGICYGHQMLARIAGGEAGWNPNGREIGTIEVERTDAGASDPLLSDLASRISTQATHSQSVTRLPRGAVHLAGNDHDPFQAFRVGSSAWGVQFHPEFDADIIRGYLEERRGELEAEGLDVDTILAKTSDSHHGDLILSRFDSIVRGND